MIIDLVSSLAGLIIPPTFDFLKKKFVKNSDTPQSTLSTLATTKPEVIAPYVEALSKLTDSEVRMANRDVTQDLSLWVADLRASIRPIFTIIAVILMFASTAFGWKIDESVQNLMEIAISSWFGSRLL